MKKEALGSIQSDFRFERYIANLHVKGTTQYLNSVIVQFKQRSIAQARSEPVLPFSKLNKLISGYFDPENIFLDNKIINFRGDLTDNSAKKEVLVLMYTTARWLQRCVWISYFVAAWFLSMKRFRFTGCM